MLVITWFYFSLIFNSFLSLKIILRVLLQGYGYMRLNRLTVSVPREPEGFDEWWEEG